MELALQLLLFVGGLALAILASGRAVEYTRALAAALGAPPFVVGVALTLSIGVGPIVAPAAVTPRLAIVGSAYALVAVAVVGVLLGLRRRHDRVSGAVLVGLYALAYVVLLGAD